MKFCLPIFYERFLKKKKKMYQSFHIAYEFPFVILNVISQSLFDGIMKTYNYSYIYFECKMKKVQILYII